MKIQEGRKAPDFTLPDAWADPVALADFKGRDVIVYFYPRDNTPGCTKEACGFRDSWKQLAGREGGRPRHLRRQPRVSHEVRQQVSAGELWCETRGCRREMPRTATFSACGIFHQVPEPARLLGASPCVHPGDRSRRSRPGP